MKGHKLQLGAPLAKAGAVVDQKAGAVAPVVVAGVVQRGPCVIVIDRFGRIETEQEEETHGTQKNAIVNREGIRNVCGGGRGSLFQTT